MYIYINYFSKASFYLKMVAVNVKSMYGLAIGIVNDKISE